MKRVGEIKNQNRCLLWKRGLPSNLGTCCFCPNNTSHPVSITSQSIEMTVYTFLKRKVVIHCNDSLWYVTLGVQTFACSWICLKEFRERWCWRDVSFTRAGYFQGSLPLGSRTVHITQEMKEKWLNKEILTKLKLTFWSAPTREIQAKGFESAYLQSRWVILLLFRSKLSMCEMHSPGCTVQAMQSTNFQPWGDAFAEQCLRVLRTQHGHCKDWSSLPKSSRDFNSFLRAFDQDCIESFQQEMHIF